MRSAQDHGAAGGADAPPRPAPAARAAVVLCIVLSAPAMLLAAAVTLAFLGPPLLFAQRRSGLDGRCFTLVKFRTMRDLGGADGRPLPDDMRRTLAGDLLRRSRLDELPQLFAILSGEMAFIGPRPLLPETVAGYGRLGRARGSVRPGLTGWAQVSGNSRLTDADKLALDIWYVAHRSPLLDLRILAETVGVVLFGERPDPRRLAAARAYAAERAGGEP